MIRAITSFGFVGLVPFAPGTFGSAAAIPVAWLLHWWGGFPVLAIATVLVFALGVWAVTIFTAGGDPDPAEVVIDEVAGQWIALWPLSLGLWLANVPPHVFPWPGWVGAFLMFRLFDIWKPGPIGWIDRMNTPLAAMLDDVLAGIFAALVVAAAATISHRWLM